MRCLAGGALPWQSPPTGSQVTTLLQRDSSPLSTHSPNNCRLQGECDHIDRCSTNVVCCQFDSWLDYIIFIKLSGGALMVGREQ